jgi:hypothetical protein
MASRKNNKKRQSRDYNDGEHHGPGKREKRNTSKRDRQAWKRVLR